MKPSDAGKLLKNGDYDGIKIDPMGFETARKKWAAKGYKKKIRISNRDYTFLLSTILGEASGEGNEVQKAIAWVILNRYNLNKDEWGGNTSLEAVCKEFKQVDPATLSRHLKLGTDSTEPVLHWVPDSIYDSNEDPTKGATYFKKLGGGLDQMAMPENCRKTKKIGNHQFYKDNSTNCNIS